MIFRIEFLNPSLVKHADLPNNRNDLAAPINEPMVQPEPPPSSGNNNLSFVLIRQDLQP